MTIEDPVSTLVMFFLAVALVIAATYLLFIAGSVVICRILQKNKRYYYKTSHFVSVSSMAYRMKRNGAGLASICILCTMVLVMLSATTCLYIGTEDSLKNRYPRSINLNVQAGTEEMLNSERAEQLRTIAGQTAAGNGLTPENIQDYRMAEFGVFMQRDQLLANTEGNEAPLQPGGDSGTFWQVMVVSLEDYNAAMGLQEKLAPDETIVCTDKMSYKEERVCVQGAPVLKVKRRWTALYGTGRQPSRFIPPCIWWCRISRAMWRPCRRKRRPSTAGRIPPRRAGASGSPGITGLIWTVRKRRNLPCMRS